MPLPITPALQMIGHYEIEEGELPLIYYLLAGDIAEPHTLILHSLLAGYATATLSFG
jgi:hypothetical protein